MPGIIRSVRRLVNRNSCELNGNRNPCRFFGTWSRRYEYEADAYAKEIIGGVAPLVGALRKLNEKSLSNLKPHPLNSGSYYSHPTLLERERALSSVA
jgi:Zn-dependent protease with chaperone function